MKSEFCFYFVCATLSAQWINHPTPGMPRTPDGKPNLSALAPRTADGKPDLRGLWGMNPGPYTNIATDLKPEDVQPWADALSKQHAGTFGRDDPAQAQCLPQGPRANLYPPEMEKFIQTPGVFVVLIEDLRYRQIFVDGRQLPKDPDPSFMGYSVGHWDGDTLVAETEILDCVCAENEKDHKHLVGTVSDSKPAPVTVVPEVLAQYVGAYEFAFPENPTVPATYRITMSGGGLFMETEGKGKTPLIPVSETVFLLREARIELMKDTRGAVTHFTRTWVEGDLKYTRKPEFK